MATKVDVTAHIKVEWEGTKIGVGVLCSPGAQYNTSPSLSGLEIEFSTSTTNKTTIVLGSNINITAQTLAAQGLHIAEEISWRVTNASEILLNKQVGYDGDNDGVHDGSGGGTTIYAEYIIRSINGQDGKLSAMDGTSITGSMFPRIESFISGANRTIRYGCYYSSNWKIGSNIDVTYSYSITRKINSSSTLFKTGTSNLSKELTITDTRRQPGLTDMTVGSYKLTVVVHKLLKGTTYEIGTEEAANTLSPIQFYPEKDNISVQAPRVSNVGNNILYVDASDCFSSNMEYAVGYYEVLDANTHRELSSSEKSTHSILITADMSTVNLEVGMYFNTLEGQGTCVTSDEVSINTEYVAPPTDKIAVLDKINDEDYITPDSDTDSIKIKANSTIVQYKIDDDESNIVAYHITPYIKQKLSRCMVGDVNGDGEIDNQDYALLMQYLKGWDVPINLEVADTDGSGKITDEDCSHLMDYRNNGYAEGTNIGQMIPVKSAYAKRVFDLDLSDNQHLYGHTTSGNFRDIKNDVSRGINIQTSPKELDLAHNFISPLPRKQKSLYKVIVNRTTGEKTIVSNVKHYIAKDGPSDLRFFEVSDTDFSNPMSTLPADSFNVIDWTGSVANNFFSSNVEEIGGNYYQIIYAPEELAYLVKGANSTAGNSDTYGKYYKIADNIDAFNMGAYDDVTLETTASQLKEIAARVDGRGIGYDCEGAKNSTIPGTTYSWAGLTDYHDGMAFAGTFDFNGCVVYNLYAGGNAPCLFPYIGVGATIENLVLKSMRSWQWNGAHHEGDITKPSQPGSGILFGQTDNGGVYNGGDYNITIRNCIITDCYANSFGQSRHLIGGWTKYAHLLIEDCLVTGNILEIAQQSQNGETKSDLNHWGGLVGYTLDGLEYASNRSLNIARCVVTDGTVMPSSPNPHSQLPVRTSGMVTSYVTDINYYDECYDEVTDVKDIEMYTTGVFKLIAPQLRGAKAREFTALDTWHDVTLSDSNRLEELYINIDLSKPLKVYQDDGTVADYLVKSGDQLYIEVSAYKYDSSTYTYNTPKSSRYAIIKRGVYMITCIDKEDGTFEYRLCPLYVSTSEGYKEASQMFVRENNSYRKVT